MQYFLNFVFDSNFDGHNNPLTFNIVLSPPPTLHTLSYTISQVHSSSSGNPNSSYLNKNNTTKAAADIEMEMGKETGKLNDLSVINGQLRLHLEQPHASDSIRSKLSLDSVAASVPVLPLEVWWRVARFIGPDQHQLLQLALSSRTLCAAVIPLLYRFPRFKTTFAFANFILTLQASSPSSSTYSRRSMFNYGVYVHMLDFSGLDPKLLEKRPCTFEVTVPDLDKTWMDNSRVYFTTKQLLSGVRTKFHFENDDSVQPLIDSLHRRNYDVMLDLIDVRPPLQLLQRQRSTVQQQEGSIVLQQTLTVERDLLASCVARLQDVIRFLESPPRMRGMVDDLDDKGEMDRAMTIRESSANTSGSIATTTVAAVVATPIPPVPHLPQPALPLLPPLTADISILTTTHLGYTLLESALDALVELSFRCPLGALLDPHIQRVLYPAGRTRGALQSVTMAGLMLTRHRLSNFLGLYRNFIASLNPSRRQPVVADVEPPAVAAIPLPVPPLEYEVMAVAGVADNTTEDTNHPVIQQLRRFQALRSALNINGGGGDDQNGPAAAATAVSQILDIEFPEESRLHLNQHRNLRLHHGRHELNLLPRGGDENPFGPRAQIQQPRQLQQLRQQPLLLAPHPPSQQHVFVWPPPGQITAETIPLELQQFLNADEIRLLLVHLNRPPAIVPVEHVLSNDNLIIGNVGDDVGHGRDRLERLIRRRHIMEDRAMGGLFEGRLNREDEIMAVRQLPLLQDIQLELEMDEMMTEMEVEDEAEIMRNNPIRTNHTTALTSDYPASLQKPSSNFRAPQIKNSHVRVSVASLIQVSEKCPNLQYLNLSYNLSSTLQPDMFIKEVGEFKSNMSFTPPDYLTHIPVTPNNALDRILRNCPRLALIDVRACDWVNMETFEVIARLTRGSKTTTTNGAVSPSFAKSSSSLTSPVAKSLCHFNTLNCVLETPQLVRNFNMNSPQHLALAIEKHLSH